MDPVSSGLWHGTSVFMSAHKYYIWMFESAIIGIATKEGPSMYPPIFDPCNISLPYWDWERDFDDNVYDKDCPGKHSSMWSNGLFGEVTNTQQYYVTGATFSMWELVYPVSSNPYHPLGSKEPNYNKRLKRWLNCTSSDTSLTVGPAQLMHIIATNSRHRDFSNKFSGGAHRAIHQFLGFSMATMQSPDDPLFFLHHCNIDIISSLGRLS